VPVRKTNEPGAELAQRAADAFSRAFTDGEVDAFLDLLTHDVDFEMPSVMQATELHLKGCADVRDYLEKTQHAYSTVGVKINVVRDLGGGRYLVLGRWRATPFDTTTPFATPFGSVFDLKGDKVSRVRSFFDEQLAVEAAGRA
jgi:ketosteroid isomerase-like protein